MKRSCLITLLLACSAEETKVTVEYFDPPSGQVFEADNPSVTLINLDEIGDICLTQGGSEAEWGTENCEFLAGERNIALEECGFNGISIAWNQGQNVESANYSVLSPSCEENCDPVLPWANDELVKAFAKWQNEVKCLMNDCENPAGPGSWQANCDQGEVNWSVSLDGLTAVSEFSYSNCEKEVSIIVHDAALDPDWTDPTLTTTQSIRLIANGTLSQRTDFGGNGSETGSIDIEGDFVGQITSQIEIIDKERGDGSFLAGCTENPIIDEICAPGGAQIQYDVPDWNCHGNICPEAAPGDCEEEDADSDGISDVDDNCPDTPNTDQSDVDEDGVGDACDEAAAFILIRFKFDERCLKATSGGDVRSTDSCDSNDAEQRWEMFENDGHWASKNVGNGQCLSQSGGLIGPWTAITEECQGNEVQRWAVEDYDQGGVDPSHPHRLHNQAKDFCLYTDLTSLVYGTVWNCGLAGTENNRKIGLYEGGDFNSPPLIP